MSDRAFDLMKFAESAGSESEGQRQVRFISVVSGKGGVGKSNVAVNLACALAKLDQRVLLLDADLGLANVNVLMGMVPKQTLFAVIEKGARLQDVIIRTQWKVDLIAGASGYAKVADLADERKSAIVNELAKLEDYDYVLVDCGAGVHDNVTRFIKASTDVLIVTTPEHTALVDAYGLMKIAAEYQNPHFALRLLINRVRDEEEATRVSAKLQTVASRFLSTQLELMGYVLEDPAVVQAVSAQKPLLFQAPESPAARNIENVARKLLNLPPVSVHSGFRGLLRRLFDLE